MAIVVATVVIVGVGVYVVTQGGGGLGGLPAYPGAVENTEGTALAKAGLENMGASAIEVGVYNSTQDVPTIASWPKFKMIELGWTKENEDIESSSGGLVFKRGNDGVFIFLSSWPDAVQISLVLVP